MIGAPADARMTAAVLLLSSAAACAGDDDSPRGGEPVEVRDSAGVTIVENRDSAWTQYTAWLVEREPFLTIGSRQGRMPGPDFDDISGAVRLRDGRVVVADAGARELRVFDRDGRLVMRLGGPGAGAGEFRDPGPVAVVRGDSIVARDRAGFRHVVFGPGGSYGRTVTGPPIVWNGLAGVRVRGWLRDGSFVAANSVVDAEPGAGRTTAYAEWHLFDGEGRHVRRIARLPAFEANAERAAAGRVALGPRGQAAVGPDGLWFGYSAAYELRHYATDGLDRIVRRRWHPEEVPAAVGESYRAWLAESSRSTVGEGAMSARDQTAGPIDGSTIADTLPAFGSVAVTTDGYLWVEEPPTAEELARSDWDWAGPPPERRWSVFDPDGRWLGTVRTPGGVRIHEIGPDYVLGVRTDELGVPVVVVHRILKPDAAGGA